MGQRGEERARAFLLEHTFHIHDTNVSFGGCEIDIVAFDITQHELVFVEVKTRSTAAFGDPSQAVTKSKIYRMQRVAVRYLRHKKWQGAYRFDVIAIVPGGIEHYRNVTW